MDNFQIQVENTMLTVGSTLRNIVIFCSMAALIWWFVNGFSVSESEGFDPLRYEFYARHGLPQAFSDSSSYRMVLVLEFIYRYLPYFTGYVLIIAVICFGIRYFDYSKTTSIAIFSPITFYYIAQTGKDGIAILAIISAATLISAKRGFGLVFFALCALVLAFYVRPAVILIIPIVLIQFRFGTIHALIACVFMGIVFLNTSDGYSILSNLEGLTGDEGAGQFAQIIRRFTFGYDFQAIMYKIGLLCASFLFQPALGLLKFYFGSPNFVLFEAACYLVFLVILYRENLITKFLVSSLPYAIIIGVSSPFYHFRYLAVAYPVIWAYCRYSTGWGLWGRSKPEFGPRVQIHYQLRSEQNFS